MIYTEDSCNDVFICFYSWFGGLGWKLDHYNYFGNVCHAIIEAHIDMLCQSQDSHQ